MSLKSNLEEMPGEKQVAWALRLLITVLIMAFGTINWHALQKLDGISETQAVQTVQLNRLLIDDNRRVNRMDELQDLYYLLRDRIQALELRLDQRDKRDVPPER